MATATAEKPKTKKKASKKKATKKPAQPGQLFETQKLTPKVKRLASKYKEASVTKSQAGATFKAAHEALIEQMKEDGVDRVLVEMGGVRKIIRLSEKDVLKIETVKEETPEAGS